MQVRHNEVSDLRIHERRQFARSPIAASDVRPTSLDTFTEEEQMLRESGMFLTSTHWNHV